MCAMRIRTGPTRVVASGQVTTFSGGGVQFFIDEWQLRLGFDFALDGGETEVRVDRDEHHVLLSLLNFDEPGKGSSVPVWIIQREHRHLWLHFRVFRYGDTPDYTLHYTLYVSEEAQSP